MPAGTGPFVPAIDLERGASRNEEAPGPSGASGSPLAGRGSR
jgi:hypothetical protein